MIIIQKLQFSGWYRIICFWVNLPCLWFPHFICISFLFIWTWKCQKLKKYIKKKDENYLYIWKFEGRELIIAKKTAKPVTTCKTNIVSSSSPCDLFKFFPFFPEGEPGGGEEKLFKKAVLCFVDLLFFWDVSYFFRNSFFLNANTKKKLYKNKMIGLCF